MSAHLRALRQVDPVLTNLSVGYRQAGFIGEQLFPVVFQDKEGFKVPVFGKASFIEYETERAVGAESNIITLDSANTLPVVLEEHDLAVGVDYREQAESMFDEKAKATRRVTSGIQLRQEIQIAKMVQTKSVYGKDLSTTLTGDNQWSSDKANPQKAVSNAKESVRLRTGQKPNIMVIGAAVLNALKFHPQLLALLGIANLKMLTMEHMKALFEVDEIIVGEAVSAPNGKEFSDIWGNFASLIIRPKSGDNGGDETVPSFGYTFRKRGMPVVDRYDGVGGKVQFVRYTDIRKAAVVGGEGGYLFDKVIA